MALSTTNFLPLSPLAPLSPNIAFYLKHTVPVVTHADEVFTPLGYGVLLAENSA